mmetsp:Transcript_23638/g.59536  ORF Transcript_23638/g.59536 Transcript_23638/m.59536 type:complete len:108 (-) Transcript_23638:78-401(-)
MWTSAVLQSLAGTRKTLSFAIPSFAAHGGSTRMEGSRALLRCKRSPEKTASLVRCPHPSPNEVNRKERYEGRLVKGARYGRGRKKNTEKRGGDSGGKQGKRTTTAQS